MTIIKLSHDEISENRSKLETIQTVKRMPIYIIADSIRSAYNIGSIFRTSDGAMVEKIYLTGYSPTPIKKEVLKTALGATESVPWEFVKNPLDVVTDMKRNNVTIAALELTHNSTNISDADISIFPLCLILGNEITGVDQNLLNLCDIAFEIPQYGIKQSLNVSVAFGIALFRLREVFDKSTRT